MSLIQIWDKMKKPFNLAWRAGVIVIALGMTCGFVEELVDWIDDLFYEGVDHTE